MSKKRKRPQEEDSEEEWQASDSDDSEEEDSEESAEEEEEEVRPRKRRRVAVAEEDFIAPEEDGTTVSFSDQDSEDDEERGVHAPDESIDLAEKDLPVEELHPDLALARFREYVECKTEEKRRGTRFWRHVYEVFVKPLSDHGHAKNQAHRDDLLKRMYNFSFKEMKDALITKCYCCNIKRACTFEVYENDDDEEEEPIGHVGWSCKGRMEALKNFLSLLHTASVDDHKKVIDMLQNERILKSAMSMRTDV